MRSLDARAWSLLRGPPSWNLRSFHLLVLRRLGFRLAGFRLAGFRPTGFSFLVLAIILIRADSRLWDCWNLECRYGFVAFNFVKFIQSYFEYDVLSLLRIIHFERIRFEFTIRIKSCCCLTDLWIAEFEMSYYFFRNHFRYLELNDYWLTQIINLNNQSFFKIYVCQFDFSKWKSYHFYQMIHYLASAAYSLHWAIAFYFIV